MVGKKEKPKVSGNGSKRKAISAELLSLNFRRNSRSKEYDHKFTRVEELIFEVKIEEAMSRTVISASTKDRLSQVKEKMKRHRISGMPVVEGEKLVGMISTEDIIKALEAGYMEARVQEKMASRVLTCYADEPLARVIRRFDIHGFGRFPVIDHQGNLVGIITRGDIIQGLLRALEKDYHEEEVLKNESTYLLQHVESERTRLLLSYHIEARNFGQGGNVAKQIKQALVRLGANPQTVRRTAIATFEAETNVMIHGEGGLLTALIHPYCIRVRTIDHGPGIPDITKALKPGFSTAPEWARELGFGSGMGLNNIQRCTEEMRLHSTPGKGTTLTFTIIPKTSILLREQDQRREKDDT